MPILSVLKVTCFFGGFFCCAVFSEDERMTRCREPLSGNAAGVLLSRVYLLEASGRTLWERCRRGSLAECLLILKAFWFFGFLVGLFEIFLWGLGVSGLGSVLALGWLVGRQVCCSLFLGSCLVIWLLLLPDSWEACHRSALKFSCVVRFERRSVAKQIFLCRGCEWSTPEMEVVDLHFRCFEPWGPCDGVRKVTVLALRHLHEIPSRSQSSSSMTLIMWLVLETGVAESEVTFRLVSFSFLSNFLSNCW